MSKEKDEKKDKNRMSLEAVISAVNKKFGQHAIKKVTEAKSLSLQRISSGIFSLDIAIGGGFPRGRASLIIGEKSSGKTTVANKVVASFQKHCRNCSSLLTLCKCKDPEPMRIAYVDAEGTYDPVWSKSLGVNNDNVHMVQPDFAEMAVDTIELLLRTGEIDLLVIDSNAALVPSVEIEASSEDQFMGVHARLLNKMCRAITAAFNNLGLDYMQKPHVIMINQFREKLGISYGSPLVIPGGRGQHHLSAITIEMKPAQRIGSDGTINPKQDKFIDATQSIIGTVHNFEITKNKTFSPFKRGSFKLFNTSYTMDEIDYKKGSHNEQEQIFQYGVAHGFIEKTGAWYSYQTHKLGQGIVNASRNLSDEQVSELKLAILRKELDM